MIYVAYLAIARFLCTLLQTSGTHQSIRLFVLKILFHALIYLLHSNPEYGNKILKSIE